MQSIFKLLFLFTQLTEVVNCYLTRIYTVLFIICCEILNLYTCLVFFIRFYTIQPFWNGWIFWWHALELFSKFEIANIFWFWKNNLLLKKYSYVHIQFSVIFTFIILFSHASKIYITFIFLPVRNPSKPSSTRRTTSTWRWGRGTTSYTSTRSTTVALATRASGSVSWVPAF